MLMLAVFLYAHSEHMETKIKNVVTLTILQTKKEMQL